MPTDSAAITATNLSVGWGLALEGLLARGITCFEPLVFTLTGFDAQNVPQETPSVRAALDAEFEAQRRDLTVNMVANTIFPASLWNANAPRSRLYQRYARIKPRLHRDRRNQHGLYFERLTDFGSGPCGGNQLEHIIRTYKGGNHRRTALQASVFDPQRDHTNQRRRGFPCLQHVGFSVDEASATLAVHGLYTTQYVFERAYGNYLGLCWLGRFMAAELGCRLERMTCFVGRADLGDVAKDRLGALGTRVRAILGNPPVGARIVSIAH